MLEAYFAILLPSAADRREQAKETVVEDLSCGYQRESHTESYNQWRVTQQRQKLDDFYLLLSCY